MKSKFAKFVDFSLGAVLLFLCVAAIARYYTTLELAVYTAFAVTLCSFFIFSFFDKKRDGDRALSKAASDMFYDFMFEPNGSPARKLCAALVSRGEPAKIHGDAMYLRKTAAFFSFDAPPDKYKLARMLSRAKHYGATKTLIFTRSPLPELLEIDGMKTSVVCGNDVYTLFASLDALPQKKFSAPRRARFAAFCGALGKDRIIRYFMLSASLFGIYFFTRSPVALGCGSLCAALALVSTVVNIVKTAKQKPTD